MLLLFFYLMLCAIVGHANFPPCWGSIKYYLIINKTLKFIIATKENKQLNELLLKLRLQFAQCFL